jgi:hypothetical protein
MLWNYENAKEIFIKTSKKWDDELKAMFSLAVTYYKLWEKENVYNTLEKMQKSKNFENALNDYYIWTLYYLYDDYEKASENTKLLMWDRPWFSFYGWRELLYSLFKYDKKLFNKKINYEIENCKSNINDIKNNLWDYKDNIVKEKNLYLENFSEELERFEKIKRNIFYKPKINTQNLIASEYYWCSLFDCKRHWNIKNDNY